MFLVALDFEGVLVKGEYLQELATFAGKNSEVEKLTKDGIEGRIDWKEALKLRVEHLKGVEYEKCVEAAKKLELYDGAKEFVDALRDLSEIKVGIITGCFDIAVNPVKEKLGLDFAVANRLLFNSGKLNGVEISVDVNKDVHMECLANRYGIEMENVIAIGDGANDISMVSKAGLGIGFNPAKILEKYAKINLYAKRLDEALPIIKDFIEKRHGNEALKRFMKEGKQKALICDPIDKEGIELLRRSGFEVALKPEISYEDLKSLVSDYQVLIVRSRTKVTKEIIDAGRNLKIIARAGSGVDNIDVEYAEKKGIKVVCASESVTTSVAELTVGLMISLARHIPKADRAMKEGKWIRDKIEGWELQGKTVGIIGFGRIGQRVAKIAKALGMKIIVCELNSPPENLLKDLDAKLLPLKDLLKSSDIITLHVPLTQQTYHLIGEKEIQEMKKGAYIVNTSRGPIIDEKALFEALKTGKLGGAAVDVYEKEPPEDYSFIKLPNVICTPHIGAQTLEAQRNASLAVATKIVEILKKSPEKICDYKCRECSEY
jgi:D-3-phosphoglycerate dehydrogenase